MPDMLAMEADPPEMLAPYHCHCCGSDESRFEPVLWKELILQWGISDTEVSYINRQQGLRCASCGANLRSIALARAVMSCFDHVGTFDRFVATRLAKSLRVLEINEAGDLTPFLRRLRRFVPARYPEVDMTRMPYADESFDLVIHSDTLEHVPDPVAGLAECRRVLRPGGFCCFTIPVIVDRMTQSRAGKPPSYHGNPQQMSYDWQVQTEYGCDGWKHVFAAGFSECRISAVQYPAAIAWAAKR